MSASAGPKRNRLFMAASQSLYAVYVKPRAPRPASPRRTPRRLVRGNGWLDGTPKQTVRAPGRWPGLSAHGRFRRSSSAGAE